MSVVNIKPRFIIKVETIVIGIVLRRRVTSMNELECRECNEPTSCDETAVAITCSDCVMERMLNGYSKESC